METTDQKRLWSESMKTVGPLGRPRSLIDIRRSLGEHISITCLDAEVLLLHTFIIFAEAKGFSPS